MAEEEALYTVVAEGDTYRFKTAEEFYDFMSEQNSALTINRIEKHEN
ncbi:hypothetical protein [Paenibacillus xerothermodurans]|nr:hypothetical protein [Paenibacillus xerothermodurans]